MFSRGKSVCHLAAVPLKKARKSRQEDITPLRERTRGAWLVTKGKSEGRPKGKVSSIPHATGGSKFLKRKKKPVEATPVTGTTRGEKK